MPPRDRWTDKISTINKYVAYLVLSFKAVRDVQYPIVLNSNYQL